MQRKSTREAKQEVLRSFMETTIAQAAKEIFAEQGYHHAKLEDIAQRIDLAKSTIYLYFKNKDELFLQVVEDLVSAAIAVTAQEAVTPKAPLEKLAGIVRGKIEFYERERDFFRIYLHEKHGLEVAPKDPHKQTLRAMYLQEVQMMASVLQEGMDAGVLRPMESRRLAFFLQEMINTILGQRIQGKATTSLQDDVAQLLNLFLHGACRPEQPDRGSSDAR